MDKRSVSKGELRSITFLNCFHKKIPSFNRIKGFFTYTNVTLLWIPLRATLSQCKGYTRNKKGFTRVQEIENEKKATAIFIKFLVYESQHYEDFASIKGWKSFFILIPIYQKIVYKRKECDYCTLLFFKHRFYGLKGNEIINFKTIIYTIPIKYINNTIKKNSAFRLTCFRMYFNPYYPLNLCSLKKVGYSRMRY